MSKLTLAEAISDFGKDAKAALTNPAISGQPEDQLRTPLINLFQALATLAGKAPGSLTLVGETSLAEMQTRPDFAATLAEALQCGQCSGPAGDLSKSTPFWIKMDGLLRLIIPHRSSFTEQFAR